MNILLWILQIILCAFFLFSGYEKINLTWQEISHISLNSSVNRWLVVMIGWSEIVGAIGLILPAVLKVLPVLTPWAAASLAFVMTMATVFHLVQHEFMLMVLTLAIALSTGLIAYGRFVLRPISRG